MHSPSIHHSIRDNFRLVIIHLTVLKKDWTLRTTKLQKRSWSIMENKWMNLVIVFEWKIIILVYADSRYSYLYMYVQFDWIWFASLRLHFVNCYCIYHLYSKQQDTAKPAVDYPSIVNQMHRYHLAKLFCISCISSVLKAQLQ